MYALIFVHDNPEVRGSSSLITIVEEVILFEGGVAGGLHHEVRLDAVPVELHPLVDDVPVAHTVEAVVPPSRRDESCEGHAGPRVRHHRRPWVLPQHDRRHQRDQPVAVDGGAARVDHPAAVHVRVEDDAEVGAVLEDRGAGQGHGGSVLRVGDVVGEHAVRLQVEAAEGVRPQLVQNVPREEAAGAVSGVHYHLQLVRSFVVKTSMRSRANDQGESPPCIDSTLNPSRGVW